MKKIIKKNGFSLIELILSLAIISLGLISITIYSMKEAERNKAEAAGEQFAELGKSLNNYITKEIANLKGCIVDNDVIEVPLYVLTQSTGATVVGTCLLEHNELAPRNISNTNILGTEYDLFVKKNSDGLISGMVLSSSPIIDSANPTIIRYDWIGAAMKKAGAASGMTFTGQPNAMKGLGSGWELMNTDFPFINREGLMGYRVGYQANYDDIYLRLDGAYPMQGNLNMGNYNINNATDINFNGWLNGNNALLNNLKTGYISNSGNIQTDTLNTIGRLTVGEYLDINGQATEGTYCESNSLMGKSSTNDGSLLNCENNIWTKVGGSFTPFYSNSAPTRDSGTITLDLPSMGILMATGNHHEVSDYQARTRINVNGVQCAHDRSLFYDASTHKYSSASCSKILHPGINTIRIFGDGDNGNWHVDVAVF